ncbi:hypothetical protein BDV06DRAFT_154413 [Aspergillus oleicola]
MLSRNMASTAAQHEQIFAKYMTLGVRDREVRTNQFLLHSILYNPVLTNISQPYKNRHQKSLAPRAGTTRSRAPTQQLAARRPLSALAAYML